jgi:hypothetical protein
LSLIVTDTPHVSSFSFSFPLSISCQCLKNHDIMIILLVEWPRLPVSLSSVNMCLHTSKACDCAYRHFAICFLLVFSSLDESSVGDQAGAVVLTGNRDIVPVIHTTTSSSSSTYNTSLAAAAAADCEIGGANPTHATTTRISSSSAIASAVEISIGAARFGSSGTGARTLPMVVLIQRKK